MRFERASSCSRVASGCRAAEVCDAVPGNVQALDAALQIRQGFQLLELVVLKVQAHQADASRARLDAINLVVVGVENDERADAARERIKAADPIARHEQRSQLGQAGQRRKVGQVVAERFNRADRSAAPAAQHRQSDCRPTATR